VTQKRSQWPKKFPRNCLTLQDSAHCNFKNF